MGSKSHTDLPPQAISVMNFVDRFNKDIHGFVVDLDMLAVSNHNLLVRKTL
jgi:hypothetical protein